jgi:hypothetical protein
VAQARHRGLLSDEHFTVDGTLVEAWASLKSFKPKAPPVRPDDPGNPTVNFRGERRSNATHASTTDPEARLFRKLVMSPTGACWGSAGRRERDARVRLVECMSARGVTHGESPDGRHGRISSIVSVRYVAGLQREPRAAGRSPPDSLDREFKENEDLPDTTNPDDWAKIAGKKGERIVYVKTLVTDTRKPERNVERAVNTGQYL